MRLCENEIDYDCLTEKEWSKEFKRSMVRQMRLRGYTRYKQLANDADMSESAIALYMSGERIPNLETLEILADTLHCRVCDIAPPSYIKVRLEHIRLY